MTTLYTGDGEIPEPILESVKEGVVCNHASFGVKKTFRLNKGYCFSSTFIDLLFIGGLVSESVFGSEITEEQSECFNNRINNQTCS